MTVATLLEMFSHVPPTTEITPTCGGSLTFPFQNQRWLISPNGKLFVWDPDHRTWDARPHDALGALRHL